MNKAESRKQKAEVLRFTTLAVYRDHFCRGMNKAESRKQKAEVLRFTTLAVYRDHFCLLPSAF